MSESAAEALPRRSEAQLRQRQRRGLLRVRTTAEFRQRVAAEGLAQAYRDTDVVVAADAEFTDQATLHLGLGPTDPPIRLRDPELAGIPAQPCGGSGDLTLAIAAGGARVLGELLAGRDVELNAAGEGTRLQPRRELHTRLDLERIGVGRLVLHRGIRENGVVAVSGAAGVLPSAYGPLLGPYANALYSCGGADSIGLAMPGLALLGPGSPVLVGGGVGWVLGCGSGHQPRPRRLASGHARTPGAVAALSVDLHELRGEWVRPCRFEAHGSGLLVAIAAPIPLIDRSVALQAATGDADLEAPVLDLSIPRRIKPNFGGVSYAALKSGSIELNGRRLRAAPAHSPRLAASIAADLVERLRQDRFPLRLPLQPLSPRPALIPLEG